MAHVLTCLALAAPAVHGAQSADTKLVEEVQFSGSRRIPEESLRLWTLTREGEPYSAETVGRDVRTILAQGYFDDVKVFTEDGPRGGLVVIFEVREYPVILDIDYPGMKSVSQSDVLEEWRKRSIGLSKEAQFDPVKAQRAAAVIKELLERKGRPDARVTPEPEEISPTAVALHFRTDEGERVRVAHIEFEGNQAFGDGELRAQMKLVKEAGLISGLTSKDIYDLEKLKYDLDRVRFYYYDHGYLNVKFGDPVVEEAGKVGSGVPLLGGKDRGLKVTVPVEEGKIYRVGQINVTGETVYTEDFIKAVIGLKAGDVVKYEKIQKGVFEDLKKAYGERGYINFEPQFAPDLKDDPADPNYGIADFNFELDEGKSFTIHRIEFKGNTYTRDKVLRREVLLNEGDPYNQRYFDLSILRLNQLGYFNEIKDTDADIRTNQKTNEVDVDLRVQEKGRQQIQFSGGVSGTSGNTVGFQYSTNNLLGYGESLTLDLQTGTQTKQVTVGVTEPYLFDRPISAGIQLFVQNYLFEGNAIYSAETLSTLDYDQLFRSETLGGTVSVGAPLSYLLKRSAAARFARLGLSYTYRDTSVSDPAVNTDADTTNDLVVTYRQSGIRQSTITPTLTFNTLDGGLDPTRGQALSLGASLSGGALGGDVNTIQPTLEYKYFHRAPGLWSTSDKPSVFGMRLLAGHIASYGSAAATNSLSFVDGTPIYGRYFLGGEETIRGYDGNSLSPVTRVTQFVTTQDVYATNAVGDTYSVARPRNANRRTIAPGVLQKYTLSDAVASDDVYTQIGGDAQLVANFEYRRPLPGPVSLAAFFDIGSVFNTRALADQVTRSEFVSQSLTTYGVAIDARGNLATTREINDAGTPESSSTTSLPVGFRSAFLTGERSDTTHYYLSDVAGGLASSYRASLGAELRVQLPVVNVPVRLIFAYNPNARTSADLGQLYQERRFAFKFSIGRTF